MSETNNTLYCFFHPKLETQLRCNRCEKPICIKCATHTPTGYRCPECIRNQQKVFVTTKWFDYIIAGVITAVITYLGSIFAFLGFYSLLVALVGGFGVIFVVKKAIQNRRSPTLKYVMSGTALVVSMLPTLIGLIQEIQLYGFLLDPFSLIWKLGFGVVLAGYIYYQLR